MHTQGLKPVIQNRYLSRVRKGSTIQNLGLFIFLSTLTALTAIVPTAQATYTPPEGDAPSGSTVAGGSRPPGCDADSSLPFALLAPVSHAGHSATTTPTLAWFVAATNPYLVKASVYRTDPGQGIEEVYSEIRIEENGGISVLTLPEELQLLDGEQYDWQVAIACDIEASAYDGSASAKVQIAIPSEAVMTDLAIALAAAASGAERADAYASQGYWFDALGELLPLDSHGDTGSPDATASLLRDLGLLELDNPDFSQRGQTLLDISDALAEGNATPNVQPNPVNNLFPIAPDPAPRGIR